MRRRRRSRRRVGLGLAALLALLGASCGPVVTFETPDIGDVARQPPSQSHVFDADGNRLGVLRHEFREPVPLDAIPRHLIDAVVAAEDQRFWTHTGVDAPAIARAALANAEEGEIVQGGSTITQQLVKNLYMPNAPRTLRTKAREALLARDLESRRSKDEILEDYLNTVYFGNGAYGVQAAARTYFDRDPADLSLAQAALLAALIRSPETLDPTDDPAPARDRRDGILRDLAAAGHAEPAEVEAALATAVEVLDRRPQPARAEPHWVDYVVRTLLADPSFGDTESERARRLYGGGLRVHTTLDPDAQAAARAATRRFFDEPDEPEVALIALEQTNGRIVAAIGGRDYGQSQFDLATQARRQAGSTFKTFVLTTAIAQGWRPDTPVNGDQGPVRAGSRVLEVTNYDGESHGWMTLARATRDSVNGAFARLISRVGVEETIETARALGITSPLNADPSIALGGLHVGISPLELATAYGTLGNLGERIPVSPIDRIENADGEVVWRPDRTPRRVLDPGVAWVVTQLLRGVVEEGTGTRARLPDWEVAGKTGTTDDHADAWFAGYTPGITAAVWVGHPEGRIPMENVGGAPVTGGSWPARIWREFMEAALAGRAPTGFVLPGEHTREVEIDPETGLRAAPWCPGEVQVLPETLIPTATCPSPPPSPQPGPSSGASPTTSPRPGPGGSPSRGAGGSSPEPTTAAASGSDDEPAVAPSG